MVFRHRKRAAVKALRLHRVGDADKDDRDVRVLRRFGRLAQHGFVRLRRLDRIARRKRNLQAHGPGRLQRARDLIGVDVRAAAALEARRARELADKGDLRVFFQRQDAVVLEQHHRLRSDFPRLFVVGFKVDDGLRLPVVEVAEHDRQNALRRRVEHFLVHRAVFHGLDELLVVRGILAGHFEVHAGLEALDAVRRRRAPVADDIAVKAPFVAEDVGQQPLVLRRIRAVDAVVRAHDRPGLRLAHGRLKAREVDFAQRALVDDAVAGHAVVLLIVGGEMLQADADVLALHAVDVARGQLARQVRVLGKVLEVSAAERGPLDICGRTEQDGKLLRLAGLAERDAGFPEERAVERARHARAGRITRCRHAGVQPQMVRRIGLLADSARAVRNHDRLDAEALRRLQVPEILARTKRRFFFERHLRYDCFYIHTVHSYLILSSSAEFRRGCKNYSQ